MNKMKDSKNGIRVSRLKSMTDEERNRVMERHENFKEGYETAIMLNVLKVIDGAKIFCQSCPSWTRTESVYYMGHCSVNNRETYNRGMCSEHPKFIRAVGNEDYYDWYN